MGHFGAPKYSTEKVAIIIKIQCVSSFAALISSSGGKQWAFSLVLGRLASNAEQDNSYYSESLKVFQVHAMLSRVCQKQKSILLYSWL